jgi:cell division initiation protein
MRITPLDIIQKQFTPSRRGYDSDEVRAFLDSVRESMEELLKENQRLRDLVAQRDREVAELRDNEADIKDTLILARRLSDDLKRTARREADVAVGEARLEAERILMTAMDERAMLQEQLVRLKSARSQLASDLRTVLDAHGKLLEAQGALLEGAVADRDDGTTDPGSLAPS